MTNKKLRFAFILSLTALISLFVIYRSLTNVTDKAVLRRCSIEASEYNRQHLKGGYMIYRRVTTRPIWVSDTGAFINGNMSVRTLDGEYIGEVEFICDFSGGNAIINVRDDDMKRMVYISDDQ